jgi:uncharacterized cupredoxin-like copper-binding protein
MRARVVGAAAGLLVAAALSACGGGSGNASATASPSSPSPSAAGTTDAAASSGADRTANGTVEVEAADFTLSLPSTSLNPGETTFEMRNDGHETLAIEIDGPGVEDQKSATAGPGGTATLTVTLQPGQYTIYCPVGNHRAMGMETHFTVG